MNTAIESSLITRVARFVGSSLALHLKTHFEAWEGRLDNVGGGLDSSAPLQELTGLARKVIGREVPLGAELENRQADLRILLADTSRLFQRTGIAAAGQPEIIPSRIFSRTRQPFLPGGEGRSAASSL